MADAWETFLAQMGEHLVSISFNSSYAEIAKTDPRTAVLQVRLKFKQPTPEGMPKAEEFPDVTRVEDLLDEAVASSGGLEVGRLTVDGYRTFYFYVPFERTKAEAIIDSVTAKANYSLQYIFEQDEAKDRYWQELYPTADDWQVIRDMRVLEQLRDNGDATDVKREVSHWAYFPGQSQAEQFAAWANVNFYKVNSIQVIDDKQHKKVVVRFDHEGTMELADITHHTIAIARKVRELNGDYDGWETRVVPRR